MLLIYTTSVTSVGEKEVIAIDKNVIINNDEIKWKLNTYIILSS